MSKKRWLIVGFLAAGGVVMLLLLGYVAVRDILAWQRVHVAVLSTLPPTEQPRPTFPPTWTPCPTDTPYVPPTATPRSPAADEAAMLDRIEREVVALRGLDLRHPVPRWVLTEMQVRRRYADIYRDEDWQEATRFLVLTLAAFDLLEPDADLLSLWRGLYYEQVAGFYDAQSEEIYVVSDTDIFGAVERLVFAHEFGHALQDQHFDLETLGLDATGQPGYYADRAGAISALVEGDATFIQEQYVGLYFSAGDFLEFQQAAMRASHTGLDSAPRVIREAFLFPYTHGRDFVEALYAEGGWEAINGAYAALPVSSEQILHPERYLAGDQPVSVSLPPLTTTLGSDWRLLCDDPMGEFFLSIYLENWLDTSEVVTATEGWGGDRGVVYNNETTGETVMLLRTVWDTPTDAEEFLDACVSYADARFGHPADQTGSGLVCWQGDDILCVAWEGSTITVALGPERAIVDRVLAEVP